MALTVALTAAGCAKKTDTGAGTTSPVPAATKGATTSPAPTAAAGGAGAASPAPTAAASGTVDATALFKANCVTCHGDNLEGKLGPNTNISKIGATKTKDQIVAQITNGGNGMPGFKGKLKDNEISALADWLAAKK